MKKTKGLLVLMMTVLLLVTGCGGGGGGTTPPIVNTDFDFTQNAVQDIVAISPQISDVGLSQTNEVEILTEAIQNKVTSLSSNQVVFTMDSGEAFTYETNEILVFSKDPITNQDTYPYKKITSITSNGDEYTVVTENAPLTAVFETLDIQYTQEVTTGDVDPVNLAPGVSLRKAPFLSEESVSFNLDKELVNSGGITVKALGQIDMKLKFTFILSIEEGKVYGFGTTIVASQTSDIGFSVNGEWNSSKVIEIGKILNKKMKFTVTIPGTPIPVPVWVDVEIPFYVGIGGNLSAESVTKFTRTDSGTMGLLYNRVSNNWTHINTYNKTQSFTPPTLSGAVSLTGYAGPQLKTKIYDLAGPEVSFFSTLNFNAEANVDKTVMPVGYEWELKAGLTSDAGIDFGGLKSILPIDGIPDEVSENLYNKSWSLGNGPELKSIALEPANVRVEKTKTYNFGERVKIIGTFDGAQAEISYSDPDLSIAKTGSGTVSGNIYTAPAEASTGTEKLTFTYKYKNKFNTGEEIEKSVELPIEVYEPKTLSSLTVNPTTASVEKSGTLNLSNFTVTAHYTDNTSAVVTNVGWVAFSGGGSISGTTYTAPSTAGSATIRVSYIEDIPTHDDITVTVTDTPASGGDEGDSTISAIDVNNPDVVNISLASGETKIYRIPVTETDIASDLDVYIQGYFSPAIIMTFKEKWNGDPTVGTPDDEYTWDCATYPQQYGLPSGYYAGSSTYTNKAAGYYYFSITNDSSLSANGQFNIEVKF